MEKSRNFLKSEKKIFDIVKVSEKSGNSFLRLIVHKFSSKFWNAFSLGKGEKYAAKQAKRSICHSTADTCSSCGQWFSLWMLSSKFLLPLCRAVHLFSCSWLAKTIYASKIKKWQSKIILFYLFSSFLFCFWCFEWT